MISELEEELKMPKSALCSNRPCYAQRFGKEKQFSIPAIFCLLAVSTHSIPGCSVIHYSVSTCHYLYGRPLINGAAESSTVLRARQLKHFKQLQSAYECTLYYKFFNTKASLIGHFEIHMRRLFALDQWSNNRKTFV